MSPRQSDGGSGVESGISPRSEDRIWHYFIDAEGAIWHEGTEFDDSDLLNFFMKNLEQLPDGRYHAVCQGEECYLTCEDVPYVVQEIEFQAGKVELIFPGGYRELLDPGTLSVGVKNVLYCRVRKGRFPARFNRKSYLELAKAIKFDPKAKSYYLTVDNKKYTIKGV